MLILGCAMPEGESGMNFARIAAFRAGLPHSVPGVTINRFCSSGLQSIAMAADRVRAGGAEIILAGGAESMSMLPMAGNKFSPNPWLVDHLPEIYMNMGLTAECVYRKYGISREDQDQFSFRSHQNALRAQAEKKFDDEIIPGESGNHDTRSGQACYPHHHVPEGRRPARRHVSRSAGQTETRVPCRRNGDGGQLIANQRWRGDGVGDVRFEGSGTGPEADGPLRQLSP